MTASTELSYLDAKKKALSLITAFSATPGASKHYPKVHASMLTASLTATINDKKGTIDQGSASLCGPASYFYILSKTRPDLYVQAATELFLNGKAKIGDLELESSDKAKLLNPSSLSGLDWMLLTSVNPKYDSAKEQFDGITLPGKLKRWFKKSGFSVVEANTSKVFRESLKNLLLAQIDRTAGHSICLFVDAGVFYPTHSKTREALFPNHWVVLNSDIKILEYDVKTKSHLIPVLISDAVIKRLEAADKEVRENSRIELDVFTWGIRNLPAKSRVNAKQKPYLDYFLRGYHGYIKAKR